MPPWSIAKAYLNGIYQKGYWDLTKFEDITKINQSASYSYSKNYTFNNNGEKIDLRKLTKIDYMKLARNEITETMKISKGCENDGICVML